MYQLLANRTTLVGALILILLASLMFVTSRGRENLTRVEEMVRDILAPVQAVYTKLGMGVANGVRTLLSLSELKKENERLYRELARVMAENNRLEEFRNENIRFRKLLLFENEMPYEMVAAEVIARNPGSWDSAIIINKGKKAGIMKDMAVVTPEGLVGRVVSSTPGTATVLLILDPRSAVGGLVQRSRGLVLVEGQADRSGFCLVKPLTLGGDIRKGDEILSSGLGGVFPKGLAIGRVRKILKGKYGVSDNALVEPAADFARLEEVLVIKKVISEPNILVGTGVDTEKPGEVAAR